MVAKGDFLEVTIRDIGNKGQGIGVARLENDKNLAIFVNGGLIGDKVMCQLTKVKKNYAIGNLVKILEESKDRKESLCGYSSDCGGCPIIELDYLKQLEYKEQKVLDTIKRLGGIENPKVNSIVPMDEPWSYRNKATMAITTGGNKMEKGGILVNLGEPEIGFFKGSSNELVDCEECKIQMDTVKAAREATIRFMREDNITAFDDTYGLGLMKHMVVRTSLSTREVMVTYIINGKAIPNSSKLINLLNEYIGETDFYLESVNLNINKGKTKEIYGKETICLAGKPIIVDTIGHLRTEVSPRSFYQVNPYQTEKLYSIAREYATLTGRENLLDLYCGVGSIGLYMAKSEENPEGADFVLGIESIKSAVVDANRNAAINGITKARFICGKAEEELPKLISGEGEEGLVKAAQNSDVVVLDPPRKGCMPQVVEAVAKVNPERIVYISCDIATLARDIKSFSEKGYVLKEVTPVDMFPQGVGIETVALLSKLDVDSI